MGNSEEGKASKLGKSSSPTMDNNNVQLYPDWAAMQAYYGPRLAVPPYMNSTVASHAPPPYMWGPPQSMIPAYGAPYPAFYTHGGIYAHPGIPMAGTALSMETPVKSSGNTDGGFVKNLKEFDGLTMSIGNGNGDTTEHGTDHRISESEDTGGSSDGSNKVMAEAVKSNKKRSRQGSPNGGSKAQKRTSLIPAVEVSHSSEKSKGCNFLANGQVKTVKKMDTEILELNNPSDLSLKSSPTNSVPQLMVTKEPWLQDERELKRERRKQSNRESARRSRLRKQAEAEELGTEVQAISAENMTLKSEITKLMESCKKLRLENATLMEKLKNSHQGQTEKVNLYKIEDLRLKPVATVNLLARVNNSDSSDPENEVGDSYENRTSGAKLHQLLDASPRTDAVAAS